MKRKFSLTATQLILLGFLLAVLIGALLLVFPFASANGTYTPFVDALFTAATSVCVTGLTVVDTYAHWSLAGKIIILILIQIGGLGIVSITTAFMLLFKKRITLSGSILLGSAFNLETLDSLVDFMLRVFKGTLVVEFTGAVLCFPVFIPEFGPKGIWISFFHSISAFCNAGIDIIGPNSLIPYADNVWLNLVTMFLIVSGGIGFIVWWDILDIRKRVKSGELGRRNRIQALSLHTKITLVTTFSLIIGGAILFLMFEWTNPETFGAFKPITRIQLAFFQSITLRTAGFATVNQAGLTDASVIASVFFMFIGGSSVGTAGGVKTTTLALVVLSSLTVIKGGERVHVYGRTIPNRLVQRALAIISIAFVTLFAATILLSTIEGAGFADTLYEAASALGTAGLSRGICSSLSTGGKLLITACMYLGRVGPISLATGFAYRSNKDLVIFPEKDITIG